MKKQLSLHDFKNWLSDADYDGYMKEFFNIDHMDSENPYAKYVGCEVRSKVCENKLYDRIETDGDQDELIYEFLQSGGVIVETEGKMITVETEIGQIKLPRFCVKIRKSK